MEFALISDDGVPICRVGGYGFRGIMKAFRLSNGQPVVVPHGWSIDCLPCGYLRLFVDSSMMLERPYWNGSTFEIYAEENKQ